MPQQSPSRKGRPPVVIDGQTVPERLVDAALRLFAERGFEGTSVQDIVEAAHVTKGAMYHYFGAKEDLLVEIYGRVFRVQFDRLGAIAGRDDTVEQRVFDAAVDVVESSLVNLESTTIFFREMHRLPPVQEREVRTERRRYHELFRGLILEGQHSGAFRDNVIADLVVDYFFGAVHHLPMWWHADGTLGPTDVGRTFAGLLIGGLQPAVPLTSTTGDDPWPPPRALPDPAPTAAGPAETSVETDSVTRLASGTGNEDDTLEQLGEQWALAMQHTQEALTAAHRHLGAAWGFPISPSGMPVLPLGGAAPSGQATSQAAQRAAVEATYDLYQRVLSAQRELALHLVALSGPPT